MTWIKVCGITSIGDAEAAIAVGASAIGLVMAPSPRQVTLETALEIAARVQGRVELVGVFKDVRTAKTAQVLVGFDRVQFHGDAVLDMPVPILRAIRPDQAEPTLLGGSEMALIDGSEGTGTPFDATLLRSRPGPFVIAGGLNPENVGAAIVAARPFGVDVSTGVESAPGVKDREKMARFVAAVRRVDERA